LAYCVRSQRYLAHQITAPQIAGAKAIDPEKECDLTRAISKSAADIKVKESKNSEVIFHVSGMKKKAKTDNNLISPAPTPTLKISDANSRIDMPVSGCKSLWVAKLSANREIIATNSTRFDMRWFRASTKEI